MTLPRPPVLAVLALFAVPVPRVARTQALADSSPARTAAAPVYFGRTYVTGSDVVAGARGYLGVPYVLGGTTPKAFDCSGFVRWVFREQGVVLPRTAREQAAFGSAPPPGGELRAGDLLFFYGGNGAQHIAIYVGGDTIIHASSTGQRVRLDRLAGRGTNRTWFSRRLIAVRRILPVEPTARSIPSDTGYVGGS